MDVQSDAKGIIEHFLEPYLNYYLVENVQEASNAIKLLGKSQKGKAQFFLLDKIPIVSKSGEDNAAINVVKVDGKYDRLLNYLLENVFLTENEIEGLDESKIFLSKRGDFVKRLRSVSGGSVGLFEGKKIGRKKELEKLITDIKNLETKKLKLEASLESLKSKLGASNLQKFDDQLREKQRLYAQQVNLIIEIKTKKNGVDGVREGMQSKKEHAEKSLAECKAHIIEIEKEIKFIEQAMSSNDVVKSNPDQLELLAQNLSSEAQNSIQKNIELIQKKSEKETMQNDITFSERRMNELKERIQVAQSSFEGFDTESKKIAEDIEDIEKTLVEFYGKRDEAKSKLSSIEQEFFGKRNSIAEKEEALRGENRKLQKTQLYINETKDKFNDVKFQIGAVGERLKIEFEVELEDVLKMEFELEENFSLKDLKNRVENLRRKIANFGEINPMAVEAFNTMKERHTMISGQRNDILEAKESLLATISEIEETATELFKESFYKVRENFITVFRSLFSEDDSCDLVLMDEDNPLDSSIDIIARPKGKRPLSLSQLSGGEMTLTATALLFAFYLQKPAPFCIFDEVDAPLDDVNVLKFNKIIKKFSKESQFVIVTHNKATMAEVDVLYGVYMQDMGISGVSPVDFRRFGHDPVVEDVN